VAFNRQRVPCWKYSGSRIRWLFWDFDPAEYVASGVCRFFGVAKAAEAVLRRKAAAAVVKVILVNMVLSPVCVAAHAVLVCARRT